MMDSISLFYQQNRIFARVLIAVSFSLYTYWLFQLETAGLPMVDLGYARESRWLPVFKTVMGGLVMSIVGAIFLFGETQHMDESVEIIQPTMSAHQRYLGMLYASPMPYDYRVQQWYAYYQGLPANQKQQVWNEYLGLA